MRFMALLRKELRESLPWILVAVIALLALGIFNMRTQATYGMYGGRFDHFGPGQIVDPYQLFAQSVLSDGAVLLTCISAGLGVALGARHFGIPLLTKTWPFLLHRSVGRMTILGAKFLTAVIAQIVCLGCAWLLLYRYASDPNHFMIPPPVVMIFDGFLFILIGLLAYSGTALSALSRSKWYTTKVFGLALASAVALAVTSGSSRPWALVTILIAALILLSQTIHTFLTREF